VRGASGNWRLYRDAAASKYTLIFRNVGFTHILWYNFAMTMIEEIKEKFARDEFEFSKHAADQSILREISVREMRQAVSVGEIIEDYPRDKYGPSCLVLGFTPAGRPLHIQCSYPSRPMIKVITVYEPDSDKWIQFRTRRK
jgi:hypothetical protein